MQLPYPVVISIMRGPIVINPGLYITIVLLQKLPKKQNLLMVIPRRSVLSSQPTAFDEARVLRFVHPFNKKRVAKMTIRGETTYFFRFHNLASTLHHFAIHVKLRLLSKITHLRIRGSPITRCICSLVLSLPSE
jgi:hypothetical protein